MYVLDLFSMMILPSGLLLWSFLTNVAKFPALMSAVSLPISYTVHDVVASFYIKFRKSCDTVASLKVKI